MHGEKRRDHRQILKYPAKIDLGDGSPAVALHFGRHLGAGAKVMIDDASKLPERFSLLLAAKHDTVRRCKVMWREDSLLGLQFLKFPAVRRRAAPRPGTLRRLQRLGAAAASVPLGPRQFPLRHVRAVNRSQTASSVSLRHTIPGLKLELSYPIPMGAGLWTSTAAASLPSPL